MQTGNVAHQVVVNPKAAHRIMDGRVNPHRNLVSVFGRDFLVNIEEISVPFPDRLLSQAPDGIGEIEVNSTTAGSDTATFIAHFLGRSRSDVARRQISKAGVFALQVIIAIWFRNLVW